MVLKMTISRRVSLFLLHHATALHFPKEMLIHPSSPVESIYCEGAAGYVGLASAVTISKYHLKIYDSRTNIIVTAVI